MKRPLTFVDGVGTGLSVAGLLVLLWLVSQTSSFATMYREFGGRHLPALTQLVLRPVWAFGAPIASLALSVLALVTRARRATIAVALLTLVLVLITYQGLFAALFQFSGNVTP